MKDLLTALLPPNMPALTRWRLTVAAVNVLVLVHVLYACGWLAPFGVGTGFAYAADLSHVRDDVSSIKGELLEQQLWDTCVRKRENVRRQLDVDEYDRRLAQLRAKYQALTQQAYPLPSSCQ